MKSCVLTCTPGDVSDEELHMLLDPAILALKGAGIEVYCQFFDTPTLTKEIAGDKKALFRHQLHALKQRDFLLIVMTATSGDTSESMCARAAGKPCVVAVHSTVDQAACYMLTLADTKFTWGSTEELCEHLARIHNLLPLPANPWHDSVADLATGHSMDQHLPKPSSGMSSVMHYRAPGQNLES